MSSTEVKSEPNQSVSDRRERTVPSVLNGQSLLFYHYHSNLSTAAGNGTLIAMDARAPGGEGHREWARPEPICILRAACQTRISIPRNAADNIIWKGQGRISKAPTKSKYSRIPFIILTKSDVPPLMGKEKARY